MTDLDVHLPHIAAGDADAFARWLAGAERPLRNALRSFAASVDTEAVLQESLLRVWQVAPGLAHDGRPNALLRLGARIARNLAVSETRRFRLAPRSLASLEHAGSDTHHALDTDVAIAPNEPDPLLREALLRCHESLAGKPKRALDLRLASAGGAPDVSLAARLGMSLNTFLQNITRARAAIIECLKRRGIELDEARA